jgi:hypothetical protein
MQHRPIPPHGGIGVFGAGPSSLPSSALPTVVPAKAGTHFDFAAERKWIPAFAGMTMSGVLKNFVIPAQAGTQ